MVSFDLPHGYYAHNAGVTTKSAARGFEGAVAESFGVGLNVVHSQGTADGEEHGLGPVGRLPSKLSEVRAVASKLSILAARTVLSNV